MRSLKFIYNSPFINAYEGEEPDSEAAKKAADDAAKKAIEDSKKTTFTQDEVNTILAEDKRKHQIQTQKYIKQLEDLQKNQSLTTKDKENLQAKIDELGASLLTKEQLAAREREKLEKSHGTIVQGLTAERDGWKDQYYTSLIDTEIIGEAVKQEAFDADALIALLKPNSRVVNETDEDGKPTKKYTPRIKYNDTDKDNKPVTLDLTVEQAIKRMKETSKYGYLFKSTAAGGVGGGQSTGKGGKLDFKKMSHEQYLEERKKMGLNRKIGNS